MVEHQSISLWTHQLDNIHNVSYLFDIHLHPGIHIPCPLRSAPPSTSRDQIHHEHDYNESTTQSIDTRPHRLQYPALAPYCRAYKSSIIPNLDIHRVNEQVTQSPQPPSARISSTVSLALTANSPGTRTDARNSHNKPRHEIHRCRVPSLGAMLASDGKPSAVPLVFLARRVCDFRSSLGENESSYFIILGCGRKFA